MIDLAVSITALVASAPLLMSIAIVVKMDSPGPIIFRQRRLGMNGKTFNILKFRTMQDGASVIVGEDHAVYNSMCDGRITNSGKWLRCFSLDELPQFVNVLKGDMSLVGPRPDLPEGMQVYNERQKRKLAVRPGITGLAQVSGRNKLRVGERWELDIQYVESLSAKQDAIILFKTLMYVLSREGVYRED